MGCCLKKPKKIDVIPNIQESLPSKAKIDSQPNIIEDRITQFL